MNKEIIKTIESIAKSQDIMFKLLEALVTDNKNKPQGKGVVRSD